MRILSLQFANHEARRYGVFYSVFARSIALSICWLILMFSMVTAHAAEWKEGRVTQVHDGDTITVKVGRNPPLKVRLWQIDAPELAQPYGEEAKQSLRQLIEGQRVKLEISAQDRYGRSVARVWHGEVDVNLLQVQRGMAWVYRDYAHEPHYTQEEGIAQHAHHGLWQSNQPQAPWEWRRENRQNQSNKSNEADYHQLFKALTKLSFQLLKLF